MEVVENHRRERVVEALREELTEMIGYELSDPRVQDVEVVEVQVDPGLRKALIRVSAPKDRTDDAVAGLEHARAYLKAELQHRLELRRVPDLHFDASANLGPKTRVDSILRRVRRGRPRDAQA